MSKKLYEESNIAAIADAIRAKNGSQDTYTTAEMADAIEDIETGGILITKSISENGTYNALLDDNADGYSQVSVNVPSGGSGGAKIFHEYRNQTYYMDFVDTICNLDGRLYTKENNKPAYVAYVRICRPNEDYVLYTIPLLVSKDPDGVKFHTNYSGTVFSYGSTITYNNELYYVSGLGEGMDYERTSSGGFATLLNEHLESIAEAAEALLDLVFSLPTPVIFLSNGIKRVPTGYDGFGDIDIQLNNDCIGFITVFYPAGLACTAVSGSDTEAPDDTKGIWYFQVMKPQNYPVTWTFSVDINNQTVSESVTIYDAGESHTVVLTDQSNTIDFLKQEFAKTDYARLSNHIGDTADFNGRNFVRTTDEPILFINCRYRANSYYSYSCITLGTSAPAGTGNSYGGLNNPFSYHIRDIEVCSATMSGWWSNGNPVYYLDGAASGVQFSLDYDRPRINAQTYCVECDDEDELALFLAKAYLLFSILKAEQESPSATGRSF